MTPEPQIQATLAALPIRPGMQWCQCVVMADGDDDLAVWVWQESCQLMDRIRGRD